MFSRAHYLSNDLNHGKSAGGYKHQLLAVSKKLRKIQSCCWSLKTSAISLSKERFADKHVIRRVLTQCSEWVITCWEKNISLNLKIDRFLG